MDTAPTPSETDQPWESAAPLLAAPNPMAGAPPSMPMGAPTAGMEGLTPDADPNMPNAPMDMNHPNNIEAVAAGVHHNRLARMLSKVGDLLGGGTSYHLVEQPDGSVVATPSPATSGEKWGRVAQAALQGMAHGWAAGQGRGGAARALQAGVDTGTNLTANRQKEERDLSTRYTQENRQKQLFNANLKLLQLETAKRMYDQGRAAITDTRTDEAYLNQIADSARTMHATTTTYDDIDALSHDMTDPNNPLFQAYKDGRVRIHHTGTTEHPHRGEVVIIPENHMNDLYDKDWTPLKKKYDPTDLSKKPWLEAGTPLLKNYKTNAEMNVIMQKQEADNTEVDQKYADAVRQQKEDTVKNKLTTAQTSAQYANAAQSSAQARYYDSRAQFEQGKVPSNAALPVEDPRFPPIANFAPGTPGIAEKPKSGAYKVPASLTDAARLGAIMTESADNIERLMAANPQLFGKAMGLVSSGKMKLGLGSSPEDQALSAIVGSIQQYAQVTAGFHRFRNKAQPLETEESALRHFRNTPEAAKAYLDSQRTAVKQSMEELHNFENYGTQFGPSDEARKAAAGKDQRWAQKPTDPPAPPGAVSRLRNAVTGQVDRWRNGLGQVIDATGKVIEDAQSNKVGQ